jgi:chromosome segregation ATPase
MKDGFAANVPARKPRTRIGRVLTELASGVEEDGAARAVVERAGPTEAANGNEVVPAAARTSKEAHPRELEATPKGSSTPYTASRLAAGRERVASLRERLAQAERSPVVGAEPKRTAAAVLEVVEDLRARLDAAIRERAEVAETLDQTRAEVARAHTDLEKERKLRTAIETQAEDRARIAAEAVTEAEALAAERDQVLSELTEQRRLGDEQTALLAEAEAVLERQEEQRAAAAEEMAALREGIEVQAVELAEMESRIQAREIEFARAEARCRELEAEIADDTEAREALEAIEATINRRRK